MQILNEIIANNTAHHTTAQSTHIDSEPENIFYIIHLIYLTFNIFNGIRVLSLGFFCGKLKLIPNPKKLFTDTLAHIVYGILIAKFLFFSSSFVFIALGFFKNPYVPIVYFSLLYFAVAVTAAVRSTLSQPEAAFRQSNDSHHFKYTQIYIIYV